LNPGLNIFIGANGAGKSNFVESFKFLELIVLNGLDKYVAIMGRADSFLFQGSETTEKIKIKINVEGQSCDNYGFTFNRTVENYFFVYQNIPFANKKHLLNQAFLENGDNLQPGNQAIEFIYSVIGRWRIYHFQNTSAFSPLRKEASVYNCQELLEDGSNLPAFLLALKSKKREVYEKITSALKLVMPSFDEFVLEPEQNKILNDELVRLCWRQKGTRYIFQPWQMSDGILRFLAFAVVLLQPELPTLMIIDEPELGLHPESLDILSGFLHEAAFRSQLIVVTQSPDLLNTMEPEDVITVNMRNGESFFERLNRADLASWLEKYTIGDLWWKKVIQAGPTSD
jgi:predicted ATPase